MATLPITDVESLSYTRQYNFLGDIFCYNSTDSYTIKSRVRNTGVNPEASIEPVWSGVDNKMANSLNYYGFTIDNLFLGSGRINSFQWEQGTDVISKPYTMSFEIASSGNLYNLTGAAYSDINKQSFISGLQYVSDLQESVSISLSQTNLQEMTQSVSFGINRPLDFNEKLNLRNSIFSGFFINRMPSGLGMNTYTMDIITGKTSGHISFYNETIDTINSRYSFERRSRFDKTNKKASWTYSHSVQLNGNNTTVAENGTIQSVYFNGTGNFRNLDGARDRWTEVSTGIFGRITGTFMTLSGFSGLYPTGYKHGLYPYPIQSSVDENPFEGSISYSYSYTNDPTFSGSGYIHSNSRSSSVDEDGYYIISENGNYRGVGSYDFARFSNALTAYKANNQIEKRISGTFILASFLLCPPTGNFRITNESTTFQEYDGIVNYNKSFSNNPSYYPTGSKFVKFNNVISDKPPVHHYNKFLIPRSEEQIQKTDQSTEGSWVNNMTIFGKRETTINDYLQESFAKVQMPTGKNLLNYFLRNMNYSFDPFNTTFNASFEYYYSKYKDPDDILI